MKPVDTVCQNSCEQDENITYRNIERRVLEKEGEELRRRSKTTSLNAPGIGQMNDRNI